MFIYKKYHMTSALLVLATLFIFGIRPLEWKIMLCLLANIAKGTTDPGVDYFDQ